MTLKKINHFNLELVIIKMRVKTVATKNDSYDVFVYTAKLGDDEFKFTREINKMQIYDRITIDANVTRDTSRQTKLKTDIVDEIEDLLDNE